MTIQRNFVEIAKDIAENSNADVIFYNGEIGKQATYYLMANIRHRIHKQENVSLILVTPGGEPDAAYKLVRCLREEYGRFNLYVSGICKSAGTLIALGAHQITMSKFGELGPLDVQMIKDDEPGMQSGLVASRSLQELRNESAEMFEQTLHLVSKVAHGQISFKAASELALRMTTGLFSPMFTQVQAMRLGENARAIEIASYYGHRIKTENVRESAIDHLILKYPSHGCVIDLAEAREHFVDVREATDLETELFNALGLQSVFPDTDRVPKYGYLLPDEPHPSTRVKGEAKNDA